MPTAAPPAGERRPLGVGDPAPDFIDEVAATDAALVGAAPTPENAFKVELAKRTLVRALTEVSA